MAWHEHRTSAIQAWILSRWARSADYAIVPGTSTRVIYPTEGPLDHSLGYTRITEFQRRLEQRGFTTTEQTRFSSTLSNLVRMGMSPPFTEPTDAGLVLLDRTGTPLFDFSRRCSRFERFDRVPLPLLRALAYIEDRGIEQAGDPRRNPAVDWGRLLVACGRYLGRNVGLTVRVEGGSTLATQMEKYRHSAGGRTGSPADKLRQVTSASLRIYRGGEDTASARRQLIVDYLDSMPLSASSDYGEIHGLGEGLRVWFGTDLEALREVFESPGIDDREAELFKQAVALMVAVRAPSRLLKQDREGLARRVEAYLRLMRRDGIVSEELLDRALALELAFPTVAAPPPPLPLAEGKAAGFVRSRLQSMLDVPDLYALDRLHIQVGTTLDARLQTRTVELFRRLSEPGYVHANGLDGARLLDRGDPSRVVYSLILVESTENGNLVRVHADSLLSPFDINSQMKLELGSTAKLRTLVHYLEIVAELHDRLSRTGSAMLGGEVVDPITRWANERWAEEPGLDLPAFLDRALERRYSGSPHERFFTGGGLHQFHNFDDADDGRVPTVREAVVRSTNLVFVRLMRDLVAYHEARLPYDARAVLDGRAAERRQRMLESIADEETTADLRAAWRRLNGAPREEVVPRLLGGMTGSHRRLAVLYFAWHPDGDEVGLRTWCKTNGIELDVREAARLTRSYGMPPPGLADAAWLADVAPMALWCAGQLLETPETGWEELLSRSGAARHEAAAWLFRTKNRRAQDRRLRTRIEQDAFESIGTAWRRLGFPFDRVVPSLASSIGSSSDRPTALADLMGIVVNDGIRRPSRLLEQVRLAPGTPYYTALRQVDSSGERVVPREVARAVRSVLLAVVERGTARRAAAAFLGADGNPLAVGGKTGSGDNRRSRLTSEGRRISSEARNRTAAFAFFIGDRHFGVVTASVDGPESAGYGFTSSLPIAVLRLLAPEISVAIRSDRPDPADPV